MKIKLLIKGIVPSFLINIFHKFLRMKYVKHEWKKVSCSQCGEDIIINFLINYVITNKLKNWSWIDIGAHHPFSLSNTAFFYKRKIHGINIEADPDLIKAFYRQRPKDINLGIAIGISGGENKNYYRMQSSTLNTLSQEEANRLEKLGYKIKDVISVPTMTITEVIQKYHGGKFPEVLFIDVEGYDLEILKTIDYENMYPKIICAETASFGKEDKNPVKSMLESEISSFLVSKGYIIVSCTLINTIFVYNNIY
jgi:FkbM family methyltransferase